MSQCHDVYDVPTSAYASPRTLIVRIELDEVGDTVRARASLAGDGFHAEGEGLSTSDLIGMEEASSLAAGEALLEVASSLIGARPANDPDAEERTVS